MQEENDPFDALVAAATARVTLRRRAKRDFIKGPIDWLWLLDAYRIGGSAALIVGLAIWRLKGLRPDGPLTWEQALKRQLGLHRRTLNRALSKLQSAGLVHLDRQRGRNTRITILLPEPTNKACPAVPLETHRHQLD